MRTRSSREMPAPTADPIRRMLQTLPPSLPHDGERPSEGQRKQEEQDRPWPPSMTPNVSQHRSPQVVGFDGEYRREDGTARIRPKDYLSVVMSPSDRPPRSPGRPTSASRSPVRRGDGMTAPQPIATSPAKPAHGREKSSSRVRLDRHRAETVHRPRVTVRAERNREGRPVSLRLDKSTIAKIEADRIYDLILPETDGKETVTVPLSYLETVLTTGQKLEGLAPAYVTRALEKTLGDGEGPPVQEKGSHPEGESRIRRGRVPEGGGVGGEEAIMSATQAPSSPGPAERPGPGSGDGKRELELGRTPTETAGTAPSRTRPRRRRPSRTRPRRRCLSDPSSPPRRRGGRRGSPSSPGGGVPGWPGVAGLPGDGRPRAGAGVRREPRPVARRVGRQRPPSWAGSISGGSTTPPSRLA